MERIAEFFSSSGGQAVAAALAAAVFLASLGFSRGKAPGPRTKTLVFSAMLITLATVLSRFEIKFTFGGSITVCSMFFVILAGWWFGPAAGISAALAYGLLQFALEPWFIHPAQVFLDYILGFGLLGASGFFRGRKHGFYLAIVVPMLLRLACSTTAGAIFFAGNAWDGWAPLAYSLVYNCGYIIPEMALTLMLAAVPQFRAALEYARRFAE